MDPNSIRASPEHPEAESSTPSPQSPHLVPAQVHAHTRVQAKAPSSDLPIWVKLEAPDNTPPSPDALYGRFYWNQSRDPTVQLTALTLLNLVTPMAC